MTEGPKRKIRVAVYVRKSSEERLDREFNSLDAQFEACAAYVASQRAEGWVLIDTPYSDGGFSGGSMDRPGLQRLLADIEAGRVDAVATYKIDRLSRSLSDFNKLTDFLDRHDVAYVSVTQSFNTATAMGKLMRNVLASFAEFERAVTTERIRDKIAASRRKGKWCGGNVPLGYALVNRKLVIDEAEAALVRRIFTRFVQLGSATKLVKELQAEGIVTKRGRAFDKGAIYQLLGNRTYRGLAVHKGEAFPGEHEAIIDERLWAQVQAVLKTSPRARANANRTEAPALLRGLIFDPAGRALSPTHTKKGAKRYSYYSLNAALKSAATGEAALRVPAAEIERAVIAQVRRLLIAPEIIVEAWEAARATLPDLAEAQVREALVSFDELWDRLFAQEQQRLIRLLVERVEVEPDGIAIRLRTGGLSGLVLDLAQGQAA
jgi:DNA invertase Pin-like site-specific DNA recombinase